MFFISCFFAGIFQVFAVGNGRVEPKWNMGQCSGAVALEKTEALRGRPHALPKVVAEGE